MPRKTTSRKTGAKASEAEKGISAKGGQAAPTDSSANQAQPTKLPKITRRSKTRSKADKGVRLKAFWGVFNQTLRRVALFEYSERKQAEKKAEELTQSTKIPHFVQLVKEIIQE